MSEPSPLAHGRAFELLPWLVNGTLAGAEREAVETHARLCITCRRELKDQQLLQAAMRARTAADVSAEAGFRRLDRELDASANARRRYAAVVPFALSAAAGLAVLAVLLWLTPIPNLGNDQYTTLATPPTTAVPMLDVVFAEQTTVAQIQTLLDEIDAEIVAGPSDLGRYSIRVRDDRIDEAGLADLLDALATDSRVLFAGRSLIETPR